MSAVSKIAAAKILPTVLITKLETALRAMRW